MVLGFALSTKLPGALSLAAILAWCLVVAAQAGRRAYRSGQQAFLRSVWRASRGWFLAGCVAVSVFILSNPHLYPNPIIHTGHLLQFRVQEALDQQERYPALAMTNVHDRATFVVGQSLFGMTATGASGLPLEAGLFSIGAVVLLRQTWRRWRRTGSPPAEGLVILTILAYFGGVTAGLLMAWDRYLVPTLLLGTLLSGVGASWILSRLRAGPGDALESPSAIRTGFRTLRWRLAHEPRRRHQPVGPRWVAEVRSAGGPLATTPL